MDTCQLFIGLYVYVVNIGVGGGTYMVCMM
jgi:hypothetical protein